MFCCSFSYLLWHGGRVLCNIECVYAVCVFALDLRLKDKKASEVLWHVVSAAHRQQVGHRTIRIAQNNGDKRGWVECQKQRKEHHVSLCNNKTLLISVRLVYVKRKLYSFTIRSLLFFENNFTKLIDFNSEAFKISLRKLDHFQRVLWQLTKFESVYRQKIKCVINF